MAVSTMIFVTLLATSASLNNAGGNCNNDHDKDIWHNKNGNSDFSEDINVCARACWGREACTSKCMRERKEYTEDCAGCHGKMASCTAYSCMLDCMRGGEPCMDCVLSHCRP